MKLPNVSHRRFSPRTTPTLSVLCLLFTCLGFAPISRASAAPLGRAVLPGHDSSLAVKALKHLGRLTQAKPLTLDLALPLRNQAALEELLRRQADPKDALYGKYLTPDEFTDRFGPSVADVHAVAEFAKSQGLTVKSISDNRMMVKVSGSVSAVETAFGVKMQSYAGAHGEPLYAPDAEPTIPASLTGKLLAVVGLNNLGKARAFSRRVTPRPSSPTALPEYARPTGLLNYNGNQGLTPTDIRTVYNLTNVTSRGTGQTLALYELDTYTPSDITFYEDTYGLPHVTLQNVGVNGFNTGTAPGGAASEVTLDLELMVALAPSASKIIVYEGDGNTDFETISLDIFTKFATDDLASVMSVSYGLSEIDVTQAAATADNQELMQIESQGQTVCVASGDAGAYTDQSNYPNDLPNTSEPGSQPLVTSVGGTDLTDSANSPYTYVSETSWSDTFDTGRGNDGTGSGGGISEYWTLPAYQSGSFSASVNPQGSTTKRNVPDVSLYGDYDTGGYDVYFSDPTSGPGWGGYNGTSAACPLWAAFLAEVDQARVAAGRARLGLANTAIYAIAKQPSKYATDFHDINDGSNNLYYNAVNGYDNTTGWGSFNGINLFNDLVGYGAVSAPTITAFTPASGPVGTSVIITGTNFTGVTAVKFNGVAAVTFAANSATQIQAIVPTGATTGHISVTTPGGTVTTGGNFTVTVAGGSISGQVFFDHNGNGTQDTGDGGLSGWTVFVDTNGNGTFDAGEPSAVTNAGGNYTITGLSAGTYAVDVVIQAGYHESLPDVQYRGWSVTLTTGQTYTGLNFGETQTAALYGTVYNDANANGVQDAGESGLSGWTVFLDQNGSGQPNGTNPTTTSSSTGYFEFTGLTAGATYTMRLVLQNGYRITQPSSGGYYVASSVASGFAGNGPFGVTTSGVTNPPTITAFSPSSGPVGTSVTITGTNLTGATSVTFNGTAATAYTVTSATSITATVPTGATTGHISVTTPGGTVTTGGNFTVTTTSGVPTITSFSPASGPVGTSVTITGTNFTGATAVGFNGHKPNSFTVNANGTQITATVPSGATTGIIAVITPSGEAKSATNFTVTTASAPTITSFTPTSGPVGTSVTITGTNLTGATSVTFNGTAATAFTVVSATSITATVPTGATTGTISVTTPGGTATSTSSFTVTAPAPTITSFTPTSGPVGTSVTITGTNLTGATAVKFNGTAAATFSVVSATSITATVPTGATTGTIAVTTPGGTAASSGAFTVTTTSGPPTITSFSPTSGPVGTSVVITGTNLTGATAVGFNGHKPNSFTVNANGTQITATVPSGATTGIIAVITPSGEAKSATNFTVTTASAPTITSFTPTSGPVGTSVTITGTNLTGATSVKFNGTAAMTFSVVSATSITVTVPTGATTGTIAVTTPGGTATSSGTFTVTTPALPTITSFTPTSGPVGTVVVITGTNFASTTGVKFNGTAASGSINSNTQLTVTVPSGATTGTITVTTSAGTATSNASFTVTTTGVTISSFSPASGPVGTFVVLTGTGFTGANSVTFNGTSATTFTVNSATSITAEVPAGATSGPVSVTAPSGSAMSAQSYTVTF